MRECFIEKVAAVSLCCPVVVPTEPHDKTESTSVVTNYFEGVVRAVDNVGICLTMLRRPSPHGLVTVDHKIDMYVSMTNIAGMYALRD